MVAALSDLPHQKRIILGVQIQVGAMANEGAMIKLTDSNYSMWKSRMEDYLHCKDLYDPIEGDDAKPDDMKDRQWDKLKKQTLGTIRQWIDASLYNHVRNEKDPQVLWKKLEGMYEATNAQGKVFMIRKVMNLKLSEGRSVTQHLNDFEGLISELATSGMSLDDEMQACLLLGSLPDSWDTLVVSLSNSAPDGVVSMSMVKNRLLNEELRRKDGASTSSQALVTENRSRSKSRGRGHDKFRDRSKSREKRQCYHCGKTGHLKRNCYLLKKENSSQRQENDKNTTATVSGEDGEVTLVSHDDCCHVADVDTEWIVDSGASYHCVPKREYFSTYKAGNFGTIKMGNQSVSQTVGIGDICVKTNVGCTLTLKDVRHIPDLRMNLISGSVLDKEGYHHHMGDSNWKLTKGSLVVARGKLCCSLYKTHAVICVGQMNAVEDDASPNLWHRRLAHVSEKGLNMLAKKSLIPLAKGKINPCDYCLFGKQHRISFQKSSRRRNNKLELVHSDVCGPMEVESLGGNKYFLTFIDDFSRKTWIYLLRTKDQVFQHFKQFHAMVERETGMSLKCLRTDNGGEYISREFRDYCSDHGIRHEKTVPGTPQHNGVAERMNRTIVERVRSMLKMANLSKSFWGEAVGTAVYLINRLPSVPLNFDVPEEVWTGRNVTYSHLRVFGCKAFMHIPKEQRLKLDYKSVPCTFVGYGDEEFGYRLWDPVKKKLVRSRDVVFHENEIVGDIGGEKFTTDGGIEVTPESIPTDGVTGGGIQDSEQEDEESVVGDQETNVDDDHEEGVEQGEPENPIPPEGIEPQLRRSTRECQPSTRYPSSDYILITNEGEPESFQNVQSCGDKDCWMKAMQEEMNSLKKNDTYELTKLPKGKRTLKNKWVYKLKKDDGNLVRYKARLVVKGFSQKKGIDFDEIFSPVVKMSSIRVVLGLVASLNLELEQLDVKTAFLHGDLEEEIYMEQPEGFKVKGKEDMVCRLKKSLYGLKQAPRQWYKKFDSFMVNQGYRRTDADPCVYVQRYPDGKFIILLLYVDDMLIIGPDADLISRLKNDLSKTFDMKDLGSARRILGMEIIRDRQSCRLWLSQERYIERILERFNMKNAKPVSTPLAAHFKMSKKSSPSTEKEREDMSSVPYSSAVGSLMYAMVCTRPDIAHAVGVVSRFLSNPRKIHWEAVKWIFRYLRGTSKLCLTFEGEKPALVGHTDADMAGDLDERRSTSGYIFTFSGGAISWLSRLQKCVSLSTTEAEYVAATEAGKEMLWLKRFFQELGVQQEEYIVYCDSQSAIDLSKNTMYHARTKHIDVRYHWLRLAVEEKAFRLQKIHTDRNAADMLTKVVSKEKFELCVKLVGMGSC